MKYRAIIACQGEVVTRIGITQTSVAFRLTYSTIGWFSLPVSEWCVKLKYGCM